MRIFKGKQSGCQEAYKEEERNDFGETNAGQRNGLVPDERTQSTGDIFSSLSFDLVE